MNETMQTILTRRSIRNFTNEPISEEILTNLVDAAMHAPSGMCRKTWKFTVISNKEIITRLAETIKKVTNREVYDMYNPTAIIIPSNDRESAWGRDDNACALQNIFRAQMRRCFCLPPRATQGNSFLSLRSKRWALLRA